MTKQENSSNSSEIDPIITLALNLRTNKGAYAVILGSGVSKAAGVPTGWEVLMELTRRVATLKGEEAGDDPEGWYRKTFCSEPNYSNLLEILSPTPTERNQILRTFFEATQEERSQGIKQPTSAHRAIAELVSTGHVRVILTTNFDRLMEQALTELGVSHQVIDSPDKIEGALPLVHAQCTVIKLHGDYQDVRTKNTYDELETYDARINLLLDRIFDEYGLITSGWSATWDKALRDAILRSPNRRFSAYWMTVGEPSLEARQLIEFRKASAIRCDGADDFFSDISEKVTALSDLTNGNSVSTEIAVASLKRYLPEPRFFIRLHDLVQKEIDRVLKQITKPRFAVSGRFSDDDLIARVSEYESHIKTLQALVVQGFHWDRHNLKLWSETIRRVGNTEVEGGTIALIKLRRYPALLLYYTGCISALASENYAMWAQLARKTRISCEGKELSPTLALMCFDVLEDGVAKRLPEMSNKKVPASQWLYKRVRQALVPLVSDEKDFEAIFDKFEYLNCLLYADLEKGHWGPVGCFGWRNGFRNEPKQIQMIDEEFQEAGASWGPIKEGLFRSVEDFKALKANVDVDVKKASAQLRW